VKIQQINLVMSLASRQPFELPDGRIITYEAATDALQSWLSSGTAETFAYDPSDTNELTRLELDLRRCFGSAIATNPSDSPNIIPSPELFGIPDEVYDLINASLRAGKRHFIFHGPPGSGKGTQSEKLIAKYHLKHLSTGDLLRSEIAAKTVLGLEAKSIMDKGHLVPDEVVVGMIRSALDNNPNAKGFLFDGFPRTEAQSIALDNLLKEKNSEINVVLALQVDEEELVKRLLNRGLTSGRSDDNSEEVVRARIAEYHKKTSVVADYYTKFNKVVHVKGVGTVEDIFNALSFEIDKRVT
jgi:adenylate kinase